ncbi:MAG: sulfur carrier protein ThiS [bacterium]
MSDRAATQDGISLTVNGKERNVPAGITVSGLLKRFDLVPGTVVVERNREILPRTRYDDVTLEDGDRLELVHFVGGG